MSVSTARKLGANGNEFGPATWSGGGGTIGKKKGVKERGSANLFNSGEKTGRSGVKRVGSVKKGEKLY